jgi:hypothetical protein
VGFRGGNHATERRRRVDKAGVPVDADFTSPVDGMLAVDTSANKIMVRIGGVWKGVVVT